jgi:glycerophosphoryl diester phosphodiesterase
MLAIAAFAIQSAMSNTHAIISQSREKTLVIGHRGAMASHPENTLPSFEAAIQSGASATECDIWMSSDGVPMVIHDSTVKRTFEPHTGYVKDFTVSELQKMGVPTLDELCELVRDRIVLVVEIKGGEGVVPAVVDTLEQNRLVDQSIIFSFTSDYVAEAKRLNPSQYCVWLSGSGYQDSQLPDLDKQLKANNADAVGFNVMSARASLLAWLRKRKTPVFIWTVAPGSRIDYLKENRANFIITNHPNEVREQLGG